MKRTIVYVHYSNPAYYPALERSATMLADSGWQVYFLGIDIYACNQISMTPHANIIVHRLRFCAPGWRQKLHYFWFCVWTLLCIIKWRPLWIYASDALSCLPALLASFCTGAKTMYHEHDYPSRRKRNIFDALTAGARYLLSKRALCIMPNQDRAHYFKTHVNHRARIEIVHNYPRLNEIVHSQSARQNDLRIYYHGSIVPQRYIFELVEALALVPENIKLVILGYETIGSKGFLQKLQDKAAELAVASRVQFLGPCSHKDALAQCALCDIGIDFMPKVTDDINMRFMVGASVKIFDYFACGLAVLVTDLPDWKEQYVETGYGLACDPQDPRSIASALRWCNDHRDTVQGMGDRGRNRIQTEWNYEKQFAHVLDILAQGHTA